MFLIVIAAAVSVFLVLDLRSCKDYHEDQALAPTRIRDVRALTDIDFVTREAALAKGFAYFGLIPVHTSGVDVAAGALGRQPIPSEGAQNTHIHTGILH